MPRISVCIVTYNNADKIERTLTSLFAAGKNNELSVYVSDNGSSDGCSGIVKEKFPEVTILENRKNLGFAKGNNKVIPFLKSDYHFIVNPDVFLKDDVFTAFAKYFDENPSVVMAVPRLLYEDGSEQFTPKLAPKIKYMVSGRFEKFGGWFRRWRDEYTLRDKEVDYPIEVGFCSGCFICIRTDLFIELGGFDERYFLYNEDADLTREAKKYGKTMYNPNIHVTHMWERGYMKSGKLFMIQIQSMIKFFWKWRKNG